MLVWVRGAERQVSGTWLLPKKITYLGDGSGDSSHQEVDGELRSGNFLLRGLGHLVLCSYLANRRVKKRMSPSADPTPHFFCAPQSNLFLLIRTSYTVRTTFLPSFPNLHPPKALFRFLNASKRDSIALIVNNVPQTADKTFAK